MARAVEADAGARLHLFVPGIRFDTQLRFLTRDALGRRAWRNLPTPQTSLEGSGWVALMQATALLKGRMPTAQAISRAMRDGLPTLAPGDFLVRMPALADGLEARWRPGSANPPVEGAGAIACLSGPYGISWALVVGWERAHYGVEERGQRTEAAQPKALLLLDPRLTGPWATAYNARLLLSENRWLGLDGEAQRCELMGLIELRVR
jgi:hypothetical protein